MKKLLLSAAALLMLCSAAISAQATAKVPLDHTDKTARRPAPKVQPKIQVALLLDTSNSMDGLINQAKARLWNIVNTLSTLKYNGRTPNIEIALYEYGNSALAANSGYIRQLTPLTADLDLISEYLFSLQTYGGLEYCGEAIDKAVKQLEWGTNDADMKLVYIAGNEPFTQGSVSYKKAIDNALANDIYVNTIYCGNERDGIQGMWRDGAIRGQGKFFNIDHNARIVHIDTPYDDSIAECNTRLNKTYVAYGTEGEAKVVVQAQQDANAKSVSRSNMAERSVSKASAAYKNTSWDMVDLVSADAEALETIEVSALPDAFKDKSTEEIKAELKKKEKERESIQAEIKELAIKRQNYINEQRNKQTEGGDDLGKAITQSIVELASANGYSIDK